MLLDEVNELSKISQRWKNKQSQPPQQIQESKPTESKSFINDNDSVDSEPFSIPQCNNPWGNGTRNSHDKENQVLNSSSMTNQKPRVRTHAPQVVDEDTEQFKLRLEHLLNVFKTEATSEFMVMKRSMLDEQKQTITHQTEKYLYMYEEKVQELADDRNQLNSKIKLCGVLEQRSENIAIKLGNTRNQIKKTNLIQLALRALREYKIKRNQKKYKLKLAQKLRKRLLQLNMYRFWKVTHQSEMNEKRNHRIIEYHRKEMDELVHKFKKEQDILEVRLKEAQDSLDESNKMKIGMQDNLKKAFMRGVCALNFEAMNVIQGAGGIQIPNFDLSEQSQPMPEQPITNTFIPNQNTLIGNQNTSMMNNTFANQNMSTMNNTSIIQNQSMVQFHNQNRIETNEHKWKNAPLVGKPQVLVQENIKQNDQPIYQQKLMPVQNLVQQDDDNYSECSFKQEDEGRVIKVNVHVDSKSKSKLPIEKKIINQKSIPINKKVK